MAKTKLKPTANFGWMPKSIIYDPNLSAKAKFLWLYINYKPLGWNFSSERMAQEMKESRRAILSGIKELEDAGLLIKEKSKTGTIEYSLLQKPKCQNATVLKQHCAKTATIKYIDTINKENISLSNDKDIGENAEITYGNQEVNECFELWKTHVGFEIISKVKANRNACYGLIKRFGMDGVSRLIRAVEKANEDMYAPRISDFIELRSKLNALLLWAKKQTAAQKSQSRVATLNDLGDSDGIRSY